MNAKLKRGCGILLIVSVVLLSILALLPDADVDHDAGYTASELSIRETVDGSVTSTSYVNPDGVITDAIDVGYGQLAWKIREDPRVVVMERTNIRNVTPEDIGEPLDLSVVDVSFISLKLVLPVIRSLLKPTGEVLCLIKPQFEAGKDKVGKKGVVRELSTHIEVLENFLALAESLGFTVENLTYSPVKGPEGNIEFLGHLCMQPVEPKQFTAAGVAQDAHEALKG